MTTRDRVGHLLEQGKGVKEVATVLGISSATVCYHKRRLGYEMSQRFGCRYDWRAIQAYYDTGRSVRECEQRFGFTHGAWFYAAKRGEVVPRPRKMPLQDLLIQEPRSRRNVKLRLLAAGLKDRCCERCGISEWRDQPLSLELHHLNGNPHDNRLGNLALLCPNCHSQTDTWGGKNKAAGFRL